MFSKMPSICIVGFGAFGEFAARLLAPHAQVSVYDRSGAMLERASGLGFETVVRLQDIAADIVILAVPVPALDCCLHDLAPHLRPGQMIVDVCSIKEEPALLMCRLLPADVEILATHPMFGPGSAGAALVGLQIVLCPIRGKRWRRIGAFLKLRFGLEVIVATPEDHDRQAAMTQGLTHLLAHALATLGNHPRIRTRSFALMTEAFAMVSGDTPELFETITKRNRHVMPLRNKLLRALCDPRNMT